MKIPKKCLLVLIFIFFSTTNVSAQHKFGDLQVDSLKHIFEPQKTRLWDKYEHSFGYSFRGQNSEIWVNDSMSGLILKKKYLGYQSATFIADQQFLKDTLVTKLTEQLNEQYGLYQNINKNGMSRKWSKKEGNWLYDIRIGIQKRHIALIIRKLKSLPDF